MKFPKFHAIVASGFKLMKWHTLDRLETEKTIHAVKSAGMGGLFSPATTEVKKASLPFYRNVMLFRITNFATLPAFSLYYLSDSEHYHYLDGSYDVLDFFNKPEMLMINTQTVLPYLDFYFRMISMDVGEISIPGERDIDGVLIDFPVTVEINTQPEGIITVKTPLYFDGAIMTATIDVSPNGDVHIKDTKMSIQGIGDSDNMANRDYDRDMSRY